VRVLCDAAAAGGGDDDDYDDGDGDRDGDGGAGGGKRVTGRTNLRRQKWHRNGQRHN